VKKAVQSSSAADIITAQVCYITVGSNTRNVPHITLQHSGLLLNPQVLEFLWNSAIGPSPDQPGDISPLIEKMLRHFGADKTAYAGYEYFFIL
jgi:hypothetical protein